MELTTRREGGEMGENVRELNRISQVGKVLVDGWGERILINGAFHRSTEDRIFVDGWEVSSACRGANESWGVAFCYEQPPIIDDASGKIKEIELRGRVVVLLPGEAESDPGPRTPNLEAERISRAKRIRKVQQGA